MEYVKLGKLLFISISNSPPTWNSMGIAKLTINISNITSLAPVILMRSWDRDKTRERVMFRKTADPPLKWQRVDYMCILYIYIVVKNIYDIHSFLMCPCVLRTSHLLLAQKRVRLFRNVRENYRLPLNNSWSEGPPVYNYIWGSAKS